VVDIQLELLGENHADLALTYTNLGLAYEALEDYGNAMETYFKAYLIRKRAFGESHSSTLLSYEYYTRVSMSVNGESFTTRLKS
jgi:tetratricopeptide (TPR) repeat protein